MGLVSRETSVPESRLRLGSLLLDSDWTCRLSMLFRKSSLTDMKSGDLLLNIATVRVHVLVNTWYTKGQSVIF